MSCEEYTTVIPVDGAREDALHFLACCLHLLSLLGIELVVLLCAPAQRFNWYFGVVPVCLIIVVVTLV